MAVITHIIKRVTSHTHSKIVENIKHNFLPMHFEIVVLLSVTVILFPGHLEQPVEPYVSS
jgi:hypothetical protein